MCGIAGILAPTQIATERALRAMTDAQAHRGPNDSGHSLLPLGDQTVGLGHRRLSIIDLSSAGHQPMIHPQTGDQIVFNGEIYNFEVLRRELLDLGHQFTGHSDTEVLLHALGRFGPAILSRLEGMFAFAFYNARERTLLLARDSIGIKPLYISRHNGLLLFASEVRAILASGLVPRDIDSAGIAGLLAYGSVQRPHTIFQTIRSFPPGSYQIFKGTIADSQSSPVQYWTYPAPTQAIDQREAIEIVRHTIESAVKDHLVADVPVGVFLSSGLDSTVVAAMAAKHSPHIRSFTVGFADQPDLSEAKLASETAKLFGLEHTNITLNAGDALSATRVWLDSLDQPSVDGLNVFAISKAVRDCGITVALSGQGGDELFGGYPSFRDVPRLAGVFRKLGWLPRPLRVAVANVISLGKPRAYHEKLRDMARTDGSVVELYLQRRRAMSDRQLAALGIIPERLGLHRSFQDPQSLAALQLNGDSFAAISQLESRFYQGNMLLRDADVNGMAHALEIRVPLLDQRLLNAVYAMPGSVRSPLGTPDKHLLRSAFTAQLRPALLEQKKMGFTLPIRRWMVGPLREVCEHSFAQLKSLNILEPAGIDKVWNSFLADAESPIWTRAFTLVVLGSYLARHLPRS